MPPFLDPGLALNLALATSSATTFGSYSPWPRLRRGATAQKCIFFVGPEVHFSSDPKVHIFRRTKSAFFSPDPKMHIFRRAINSYFSSAQKCIFFAGPAVHIFRRTQNCIFFVGPKVHIFLRTKIAQGCGSNWALANLNFSSRLCNLFAAKIHSRRGHGSSW